MQAEQWMGAGLARPDYRKSLQVRLGHIGYVGHQVADAVAAVGGGVGLGPASSTLLAVDAVAGRRRRRWGVAGRLAAEEASIVALLQRHALLNDAALGVGDGGVVAAGAAVALQDVEVAQAEDQRHGRHRHQHQRDAHHDAPHGEGNLLLYGLRGETMRQFKHTNTQTSMATTFIKKKKKRKNNTLVLHETTPCSLCPFMLLLHKFVTLAGTSCFYVHRVKAPISCGRFLWY